MTDSDSGAISQEEIAQQFALPERKAKITQISKSLAPKNPNNMGDMILGDDKDVEYCICRSTDCSRFMIGCDKCEEWYHGDCIGVSEEDAKSIKQFFCQLCRNKDPSLHIKYKIKKVKDKPFVKEKSFFKEKPLKDKSHKHKDRDRERERDRDEERDQDYDYYRDLEKKHKKHHHHKDRKSSSQSSGRKKSSRRCGECVSCHKKEDCGRCDFCKDMKKFGGPNKIRQKCRLRQCVNFGLSGNKDKPISNKKQERTVVAETENERNIFDDSDSEDDKIRASENYSHSPMPRRRKSSDSDYASPVRPKKTPKGASKGGQKSPRNQKKSKPRAKRKSTLSDDEEPRIEIEEDEPRQCYGPACIEPAREGSKYCSEECGMKLATTRIFEILPQRIQHWQATSCVAEENNKISLEKIRRQQLGARQKLVELDLKHQDLEALIERAKHATVDPQQMQDEDDAELSVYCVTCGHEVSQKAALRHMEKCFAKYESQTSIGSIYKTKIEGTSMFCDYFDRQEQSYCKRLKVLCPEHFKEPKVAADEVCGCPLVSDVFEETGEFCRAPKRKCNKHYCWEKLRQAEIDMERVRQWMHLEDLFDQERSIRCAMANRSGVLGLMLHHTQDHDPLHPIKIKQS